MGPPIHVSSKNHFFSFGPKLDPAVKVNPRDRVIIETLDCFSNQITSEDQPVTSVDFSRVNPATGPIYIVGAEPGDALKVAIDKIETVDKGVIVTVPGLGVLGDMVKEAKTRVCKIQDKVIFNGAEIPLSKMIGVIGVASPENLPTGTPGRHGGNLDSKVITEGSTLYLPVFYEGALFGLGDLHAVMGDGEVCVAACETYGKVHVEFDVVKGMAPAWPVVEINDAYYILVSKENVEDAFKEAVYYAVRVLQEANGLDWHDAYMMASMVVDTQVSQLVNPRKTVRARIPKRYASLDAVFRAMKNKEVFSHG